MDFSALTPLAGGWSGQTFLAEAGGERSVVRIYARPGPRGEAAAEVDAALLRLVRGLVPVPEVLEVRRPQGEAPGILVTSYVEGVRGDELLPTLDQAQRRTTGEALGGLLADLGGMPFLAAGWFADAELTVRPFAELGLPDGLPDYLDTLELAVPDIERRSLRRRCVDAQALLDSVGRVCLVHSDLNPKNLVLDPDSGSVRALLDWEFAHAGHPFTDLGNLLRFERDRRRRPRRVRRPARRNGRGGSGDGRGRRPVGPARARLARGGQPGGRPGPGEGADPRLTPVGRATRRRRTLGDRARSLPRSHRSGPTARYQGSVPEPDPSVVKRAPAACPTRFLSTQGIHPL